MKTELLYGYAVFRICNRAGVLLEMYRDDIRYNCEKWLNSYVSRLPRDVGSTYTFFIKKIYYINYIEDRSEDKKTDA